MNDAAAVLIEMDTPGGLVDSMRGMAGAILSSRVPVIIYVAPSGARAGSAGFFLLEAADVAAMAPGTEAGAAHVVFEGGKPDDTEMQKVENDAEAFLRSYVKQRNRNPDAAVAAVASSHSYTAEEALSQHLIDLIAKNDAELLATLNGREIARFDGTKVTLHLAGARIETLQPTLREELLGWLVNPNIALLLLVGGALADLSRIQYAGNDCARGSGHVDGAAWDFWIGFAADSLYRGIAPGGGAGADGAGSEVWRAWRTGNCGYCLPDVWHADSGCRAGAGDGDQSVGGDCGECGIRRDYGLSCEAGGARSTQESAAGSRCAGGERGISDGGFDAGRPCARGWGDLACSGERTRNGWGQAARCRARSNICCALSPPIRRVSQAAAHGV